MRSETGGNSVTAKVVAYMFPDDIVLVYNKAKDLPHGAHKPAGWGLPGGNKEFGEDPYQAALREFYEETEGKLDIDLRPDPVLRERRSSDHELYVFFGIASRRAERLPVNRDPLVRGFSVFPCTNLPKGLYKGDRRRVEEVIRRYRRGDL